MALCLLPVAFALTLSCTDAADHRERLEFWGLGREGEVLVDLIPEFERRNPGIHVVLQQIPFTAAHEKLMTAYVGEAAPDAAQMGNTWVPEFVAMHALEDLGPMTRPGAAIDRSDYFPGIWETNVVDGVLYGIPWYVDTRLLFYRKDVLASVGFDEPPRTWEQWSEALRRIRDARAAKWGIVLPTNEYEHLLILGLSAHSPMLNGAGTRGAFRQQPFADALNYYDSFFREGLAPPVSNAQIANLYQQFAQGDFAMYITGPWNVAEFKRRLPAGMQTKWATAPMPARSANEPCGISMAGGSSLVVFRGSKHGRAARRFIEYLSEPAQQVRFFESSGDLPARRSAWSAPALTNEPHFPAFRTQLEHVAALPRVPEWEQIATAVSDRGEAVARGTVAPAVAQAQLDAKADELLEKRRWILTQGTAGEVGERPSKFPGIPAPPPSSSSPPARRGEKGNEHSSRECVVRNHGA